MQHLIAILNNKKKCFKKKDIKTLRVPPWPELAMNRMWAEVSKHPEFRALTPEDWFLHKKNRERSYFWGIVSTLMPDFVEQLIEDCRFQRKQGAVDRLNKPRELPIDREWAKKLLAQPYVSSKSPFYFS